MADATLAFNILTKYKDAGASKAAKDLDGLDKTGSKTSSTLKKVGTIGAAGLAAGVLLGGKALIGMTKSATEDAAAQKRLGLALKNNAGATKGQIAATEDWITAQGKAYGVTDDDLRPALARLVGATHDVGKAQKLAKLAMDVSAGSGKSLKMVTEGLMKAQNGNVGSLARLGIKTKDSEKDTAALQAAEIRLTKAHKDNAAAVAEFGPKSAEARAAAQKLEYAQTKLGEAQGKTKQVTITSEEAVKRLSDMYGGQAAKNAETLAGKSQRLKVMFDETKESIGARLIPVATKLADLLLNRVAPGVGQVTAFLGKHKSILVGAGIAVGVLTAGVLVYNTATFVAGAATKTWTVATKIWTGVSKAAAAASKVWAAGQWLLNAALSANPIGLVVIGIAALVAGFVIAYKKSETFRNIVNGALNGVKHVAEVVFGSVTRAGAATFGWLKKNWPMLLAILTGPFGIAVLVIVRNWDKIRDGAKRAFDGIKSIVGRGVGWVVDKVLWMGERVLDGAISAFGWAPGIGDKLRAARDKVRDFREQVNRELSGIRDENVKVTVRAGVTSTAGLGLHGGPGTGLAAGGPVTGGVPGRDSVAAWLMPGEHVLTAEEVRKAGGHGAVRAIRRMLKRGEFKDRGDVPAFAQGGPVFGASTSGADGLAAPVQRLADRTAAALARKVEAKVKAILKHLGGEGKLSPSQIARGQRFARSQVGDPYVWGGVGPNGFDCSGFVGAVLNAALGQNPYSRRGTTGSMPWGGFKPGRGSFSVGWFTGSPGHMAGSIGGMGIESAGSVGVRVGGAATPVSSFPNVAHFDRGGWLQTGWTAAYNGTGRPEWIPDPRRDPPRPGITKPHEAAAHGVGNATHTGHHHGGAGHHHDGGGAAHHDGGGTPHASSPDRVIGLVEVVVRTDTGREIQRKLLKVKRQTGQDLGLA